MVVPADGTTEYDNVISLCRVLAVIAVVIDNVTVLFEASYLYIPRGTVAASKVKLKAGRGVIEMSMPLNTSGYYRLR